MKIDTAGTNIYLQDDAMGFFLLLENLAIQLHNGTILKKEKFKVRLHMESECPLCSMDPVATMESDKWRHG